MAHEQRSNVLKKIWHGTLKQNKSTVLHTHHLSLTHTHARAHTPVTCSFSVNMHICGYNRLKHSLKNNHKNNHSQYCRRKAEEKQRSRWRPCLIEQREGNIRSLGLLWFVFHFPERGSEWCRGLTWNTTARVLVYVWED